MENKRQIGRLVKKLFLAKQQRRRKLARLPIEEKMRILIALQRMENDIRATLGRSRRRPWNITE